MNRFIDQIEECIELTSVPKRIISLVPSQTELLSHLGLNDEVVGITKFCVHPTDWFNNKIRVGGTKSVNIQRVAELQPDLIICNKEENVEEQVEELRKIAPVWTSDINSMQDALNMIQSLGTVLGKEVSASSLVQEIQDAFRVFESKELGTCLYYIWKDPDYVVGAKTYINDILNKCGFKNCCSTERYPEFKDIEQSDDPKYVLLSTEPYPFNEGHFEYFQKQFPNSEIILVDGEMFSWYGSRMKLLPSYMTKKFL